MTSRLLFGSLFVIAVLSGVVVAEAQYNYASVTDLERTTAHVERVSAVDGGLQVELVVENSMNERLRIQYVHLNVNRTNHSDSASVPINGYRTLAPGRSTLTVTVPERQVTGELEARETMIVDGRIAVEVYNGYQFEVPIDPEEVTV